MLKPAKDISIFGVPFFFFFLGARVLGLFCKFGFGTIALNFGENTICLVLVDC